ncbi:DUF4062 domain-containing protein [Neobacillus sp. 114]|uniref:DUF4062 domain-containing protein n=1 Tax=Neobacillus sp. 114 TaxID=3048535 RepID=UPI0024C3C439|nr:DUF4062 domain-containing protein [Neobacillus sp. 114]
MSNPLKIFISSVGQDSLSPIRNQLFDELKGMAHHPVMYERNIGPWPRAQSVQRCLEAVSESDIFILLISNKGGSYYQEYGATVTHLEFLRANNENKTVIPFIERSVSDLYWRMNSQFEEKIQQYIEVNGQHPDSYSEIAEEIWKGHSSYPSNSHIDSYVFGFIHDLVTKGNYFEPLNLGIAPLEKIKEYLSDLFRQARTLLAIEPIIHQHIQNASLHQKHTEFSFKLLDFIKEGQITNCRLFLAHIQALMDGGDILYKKGTVFEKNIGYFEPCCGITMYKIFPDSQELILLEATGIAGDDNRSYSLADNTSFVVQTYLDSLENKLFYQPEKQLLYFTIKASKYILCLHYPVSDDFTEEIMERFQKDVFDAILNSESQLYRGFVTKLLGGLD